MTRRHTKMRRAAAFVAAGAVAVAAWGGQASGSEPPPDTGAADGTDGTDGTAETAATGGGVEGCGPESVTDPLNRANDRPIAHCEPGAPAAQPLDEPTTITLAAATQGEYLAPVLLGIEMGEFEAENLTIEIVQMPFSDAMVQMASGQVDAANGGPFASFTNAVGTDIDIRWALANYSPAAGGDLETPQAGLWVRRDVFSDPANPDLSELAGQHIANSLGLGTSAVYWLGTAFDEAGLSFEDITFDAIQPADHFTALESGAVAGAYMLDPFWNQAAESDDYLLAAVSPKEATGGIFFGPNLLEGTPDVGAAFARAYIRTINTYLQPGYQDDEAVVQTLADAIPVDPQSILDSPELAFEWEIREGLMADLQARFIELGVQTVPELSEDELVDRSFYLEAVGAESQ